MTVERGPQTEGRGKDRCRRRGCGRGRGCCRRRGCGYRRGCGRGRGWWFHSLGSCGSANAAATLVPKLVLPPHSCICSCCCYSCTSSCCCYSCASSCCCYSCTSSCCCYSGLCSCCCCSCSCSCCALTTSGRAAQQPLHCRGWLAANAPAESVRTQSQASRAVCRLCPLPQRVCGLKAGRCSSSACRASQGGWVGGWVGGFVCLVGGLVGWLVGRLGGWVGGRVVLVGWLVGWCPRGVAGWLNVCSLGDPPPAYSVGSECV